MVRNGFIMKRARMLARMFHNGAYVTVAKELKFFIDFEQRSVLICLRSALLNQFQPYVGYYPMAFGEIQSYAVFRVYFIVLYRHFSISGILLHHSCSLYNSGSVRLIYLSSDVVPDGQRILTCLARSRGLCLSGTPFDHLGDDRCGLLGVQLIYFQISNLIPFLLVGESDDTVCRLVEPRYFRDILTFSVNPSDVTLNFENLMR